MSIVLWNVSIRITFQDVILFSELHHEPWNWNDEKLELSESFPCFNFSCFQFQSPWYKKSWYGTGFWAIFAGCSRNLQPIPFGRETINMPLQRSLDYSKLTVANGKTTCFVRDGVCVAAFSLCFEFVHNVIIIYVESYFAFFISKS